MKPHLHIETSQNLEILTIGSFDLYNSIDDRIYLKNLLNKLFQVDEQMFCYFRREENLTDDNELALLKKSIFERVSPPDQFKYIKKIDDRRFDAIAEIKLKIDFGQLVIDMWKYFYSFSFFVPINDLTFDEYEDYLLSQGFDDINGMKLVNNKLAKFICIKGLGADHLIITSVHEAV